MAGVNGELMGFVSGPSQGGVHAAFPDTQDIHHQDMQYPEPTIHMFSDWLNVSPSKDQPIFSPMQKPDPRFQPTMHPQATYPQLINFQSGHMGDLTSEVAIAGSFRMPTKDPFRNITVAAPAGAHQLQATSMLPAPQNAAQRTPLSFPTTGRTIYTMNHPGHPSIEPLLLPATNQRLSQPADILAEMTDRAQTAVIPQQAVNALESYPQEVKLDQAVSPLQLSNPAPLEAGFSVPPYARYQDSFIPYSTSFPGTSTGSSTTLLSTDSLVPDLSIPASGTSVTTTLDGYSDPEDIFPSFVRTKIADPELDGLEGDLYSSLPPSPTPLPKSRYFYDPSSNPSALPPLGPVFEVVMPRPPSPSMVTSMAPFIAPTPSFLVPATGSAPSSRRSTPAPPPPQKWFKSAPIILTEDWRLDKRAYESHRYGTRSKGKDLEGGSAREVGEDLEFIRRGGRGEDVQQLLKDRQQPIQQDDKTAKDESPIRPPQKNNKRGGSVLKEDSPAPKRAKKLLDITSEIERPASAPPPSYPTKVPRSRPSSARPTPERALPTRASSRRPVPSAKIRSRADSIAPEASTSGTLAPPRRDDESMSETDADAEGEADDDYEIMPSETSQQATAAPAAPTFDLAAAVDLPSFSTPQIVVLEPGSPQLSPSPALSSPPTEADEDFSPHRSSRTRSRSSRSKPSQRASTKVPVKKEVEEEVQPALTSLTFTPNNGTTDAPKIRAFPPHISINDRFPLYYRRFPVSSYFDPESDVGKALYAKISPPIKKVSGNHNQPSHPSKGIWNLYQPRFTRGTGARKEGLCPICREEPERGGLAKNEWFEMKTSAYNYHMQKFHGISPTNGLPFSPPVAFRSKKIVRAQKHQKDTMQEGQCHKCKSWIPVEGPNFGDTKVKELYWWKHACACHKGSMIPGEGGFYIEDDVYSVLKEYDSSLASGSR